MVTEVISCHRANDWTNIWVWLCCHWIIKCIMTGDESRSGWGRHQLWGDFPTFFEPAGQTLYLFRECLNIDYKLTHDLKASFFFFFFFFAFCTLRTIMVLRKCIPLPFVILWWNHEVHFFVLYWNISATIGLITINFCTNIQGPVRISYKCYKLM